MSLLWRTLGHGLLWYLFPVCTFGYACDSLHVSYPYTVLWVWGSGIAWIIVTLLCEIAELEDGKQDRNKYYLDKTVKVLSTVAALMTYGWWRPWQ